MTGLPVAVRLIIEIKDSCGLAKPKCERFSECGALGSLNGVGAKVCGAEPTISINVYLAR
jgi:hypothetical protein